MSLAEIKSSIQSINKIIKITSALKMISVALIYKTQSRLAGIRDYSSAFSAIISDVKFDICNSLPWICSEKNTGRELLIVITSDRGLCGNFNSLVINEVDRLIASDINRSFSIICIGKIGYSRLLAKKLNIIESIVGIDKFGCSSAQELVNKILILFEQQDFERVSVISNYFYSSNINKVNVRQLIPLVKDKDLGEEYIFEPSENEVVSRLCRHQLEFELYRCVSESYTAEQTARMLAMDEASRNARDLQENLSLALNKTRQQIITAEISEVIGAAQAL